RTGRGRTGRALRDQPGELAAHVVGERRADGREPPGLGLERRDEAGVLVAEVEVDELGREVEVAVAVLVPEPGALAARDGQRVDRALRGQGVEDVPVVGARARRAPGELLRRQRALTGSGGSRGRRPPWTGRASAS